MVGLPYDLVANPLGAVRSTFEKAAASSGFDPNGKDWGVLDLFRHFLFDQGRLSQVPILNGETIRWIQPKTLVRFRAMVQDMLGNEFYVGAYQDGSVWRTNKFTDVSQFRLDDSSPHTQVWERRLLYCVPVPGQNSWTEPSSESVVNHCKDFIPQQREKRRRMDDEAIDDMNMLVSDNGFQVSPSVKKVKEDGRPSTSSQTRDSLSEGYCSNTSIAPGIDKDFLSCLVKIYDSPESDLKLNDVFEFIGVLTLDSELNEDKDDHDEPDNGFCDDVMEHLPPIKVPRLHCLIHRKLAAPDFLCGSPMMEPKPHFVREMREVLLRHLTVVLGNDGIAAHFMLLHLLSRVHARVDTVAVGKLSLNLTCFSKESAALFGSRLSLALKTLLPFTHCIPLTLEYLNSVSLAPKKDYETNRLVTGVLQLAEGSHIIIDETQLEAGTLNSVGMENARLLRNLLELQRPSSVGSSEVVTAEALEAWRWYLATVKSLPHSIESEMQKVVENDLVAARQTDRSIGSHDFNRWLTMGRLMSLSFGETCLSLEHWQMVKELERLRRERLK
ncbi:hypothetical protein I3843_01G297700 [Carya illinoinensis]|uniref:Mini-chromosome maintenance complex-binding protein n=1 Tax=Carya illinoinensis TaxID=32201 RepID=A0A922K7N1_CARIL|nr:hypothetical protein I3760_01G303800 [Carya illinoinensis]KAG6735171.1 hypothetical protein I3842_01G308400 [Carya illinoinensis]KAG7999225.1 hypothetical protein I3843_01G297700 [Carya illinoinensis]